MFKKLLFLMAAIFASSHALAAGTQTTTLSTTAYTDLGAAPVTVQVLSGTAYVVVSDSLPAIAARGMTPQTSVIVDYYQADSSSHVWALGLNGFSNVAYTPAIIGGGGGGGGGSVTQGTSPWVDNVTQWNSVALGSPSNYGTSPGAVSVLGVNAFVTNTVGISAGSLPLPTGASTSILQTSGAAKTQIVDGAGAVITSTSNNLNVQCANCSGSGVSTADAATFTGGSSLFAGNGGFFQTTPTSNPLVTGHQGMFQVTANRALFTNLRNASGAELGIAAAPLQVDLANTSANATALKVTGTGGTFPVAGATSNASSAVATSATNLPSVMFGYGYNGTTWDQLQVDGSKSLKINCVTGCSSTGGSAQTDSGGFTPGATSMTAVGGLFQTSITPLTTGQAGAMALTSDRNVFTNTNKVAGVALGAPSNYGTSPGAVVVPGVNSFVTNTVAITCATCATAANQEVTAAGASASSAQAVQGVTGGIAMAIIAASLPLPTGAATAAGLTSGTQKTQIVDGAGSVISSTSNNLNVQCANCTGTGVSATDQASFTAGTSLLTPAGGFFQTTATANPLTNGTQGMAQLTATRSLFTNLRNSSGTEVGTAGVPLQVSIANTGANATPIATTTAGASSNASSAVATSSTNLPSIAFNYGYNGTTWDQLQVDGSKSLKINCVTGCSSTGGSAQADGAAFTAGSSSMTAIGGLYQASISNLSTGQAGAVALTIDRNIFANLNKLAGVALGVPSNYGTSPGAVSVAGVNAFVTNTVAISAGSLPLPAGAATASNQNSTAAGVTAANAQGVQGVTGGVALPISAAALPLPTGAATATIQTGGSQKTQIVDGAGAVIASTTNAMDNFCINCMGTDQTAFVVGTSTFSTSGGYFQSVPTNNPLTAGQRGAFQVTANRALFTNLRNAAGAEMATAAAPLQVSIANTGANATAMTVAGGKSNATSGVATSATNVGAVSFGYGFNGTTWDALQVDGSKSLKINCIAGCTSSGGSSQADGAAFTAGSSSFTVIGGLYQTSISNLTTGQAGAAALTSDRNLFVNLNRLAGQALGAPSAYGTSPGAVVVPGVNAFITNTPAITCAGCASATNQTNASAKTQIVDGAGAVIASTSNAMNVNDATVVAAINTNSVPLPLPVVTNTSVALTDCSGTITTGGTAKVAISAQTTLHGFIITNIDASAGSGEPLWYSTTGTAAAATAASYPLQAPAATTFANAGAFTSPPGFGSASAVSVVAATTGHKYSCTWW